MLRQKEEMNRQKNEMMAQLERQKQHEIERQRAELMAQMERQKREMERQKREMEAQMEQERRKLKSNIEAPTERVESKRNGGARLPENSMSHGDFLLFKCDTYDKINLLSDYKETFL